MAKTLTIKGDNIHDIETFYEEINRVFMKKEDWRLGQTLDGLNDMFYGGYGEIQGKEEIDLIWKNIEKNRKDLGVEATKAYYQNKLNFPTTFNVKLFKDKLAELEEGKGQTYFDIIMEIIAEHPNIKLISE